MPQRTPDEIRASIEANRVEYRPGRRAIRQPFPSERNFN